jgi:hypothetical protein
MRPWRSTSITTACGRRLPRWRPPSAASTRSCSPAGWGENAPEVRERAAADLAFLGVGVDRERNRAPGADREIGRPGSAVRTFVIAAREDVQIAHEVREVLGPTAAENA